MNDKFDELAKRMAQSVTRRGALKKFGVGLAGIALATLGLANKAEAGRRPKPKGCNNCRYPYGCENLPPSEQPGCFAYCNGTCGSY